MVSFQGSADESGCKLESDRVDDSTFTHVPAHPPPSPGAHSLCGDRTLPGVPGAAFEVKPGASEPGVDQALEGYDGVEVICASRGGLFTERGAAACGRWDKPANIVEGALACRVRGALIRGGGFGGVGCNAQSWHLLRSASCVKFGHHDAVISSDADGETPLPRAVQESEYLYGSFDMEHLQQSLLNAQDADEEPGHPTCEGRNSSPTDAIASSSRLAFFAMRTTGVPNRSVSGPRPRSWALPASSRAGCEAAVEAAETLPVQCILKSRGDGQMSFAAAPDGYAAYVWHSGLQFLQLSFPSWAAYASHHPGGTQLAAQPLPGSHACPAGTVEVTSKRVETCSWHSIADALTCSPELTRPHNLPLLPRMPPGDETSDMYGRCVKAHMCWKGFDSSNIEPASTGQNTGDGPDHSTPGQPPTRPHKPGLPHGQPAVLASDDQRGLLPLEDDSPALERQRGAFTGTHMASSKPPLTRVGSGEHFHMMPEGGLADGTGTDGPHNSTMAERFEGLGGDTSFLASSDSLGDGWLQDSCVTSGLLDIESTI